MFLWESHCSRSAGHSGALGSTTLTAILSASGHWKIESCEFVFVLVVVIGFPITKKCTVIVIAKVMYIQMSNCTHNGVARTLFFISQVRLNCFRPPLMLVYRDGWGWWASVELGRRFLFILFTVALPQNEVCF